MPPFVLSTWMPSVSLVPGSPLSVSHNCSVALPASEIGMLSGAARLSSARLINLGVLLMDHDDAALQRRRWNILVDHAVLAIHDQRERDVANVRARTTVYNRRLEGSVAVTG
jgi:hypothetical protein